MSELDLLFKGVNVGLDSKENDEDLMADMSRLMSIVEMLTSEMDTFILEMFVSPMNILTTKLEDVKHLQFHIVYDYRLSLDDFEEKKKECMELLESLLLGEFDNISNYDTPEFNRIPDWKVPTIQVFSIFKDLTLEDVIPNDNVYLWLHDLVSDGRYEVSVPYEVSQMTAPALFIHCRDSMDIIGLCKLKPEDGLKGQMLMVEYTPEMKYERGLVYVPMVGLKPLQYNMPYMHVDMNSFNQERLSSLLGDNDEQMDGQ